MTKREYKRMVRLEIKALGKLPLDEDEMVPCSFSKIGYTWLDKKDNTEYLKLNEKFVEHENIQQYEEDALNEDETMY